MKFFMNMRIFMKIFNKQAKKKIKRGTQERANASDR